MTEKKKMLKITKIVSAIRRPEKQTQILNGLGLKKLHRSLLIEDTPSIRGMIEKVKHLIAVETV